MKLSPRSGISTRIYQTSSDILRLITKKGWRGGNLKTYRVIRRKIRSDKIKIRRIGSTDDIDDFGITGILKIQKEFNLGSWSENDYRNEPGNSNSIFLVIECKKCIVGFLIARVSVSDIVECDLLNFAISSDYQNYGFGKKLFNELTNQTEFKDVQAVWLEVRRSNHKAVEFYFRRSFRFIQMRKNFYTNPLEDALVLRLQMEREIDKKA